MVAQQDETIDAIETHAAQANKDMEQGCVLYIFFTHTHPFFTHLPWPILIPIHPSLQETDKAVEHARAARRKRWICFWITIVILAIVAIVLAVVLTQVIPKNK
jgi:syntaxin 1B/2/3